MRSRPLSAPADRLGILLLSASSSRVHAAMMLATTAASLGRAVVLFATDAGVAALLAEGAAGQEADGEARRRSLGVATCAELAAAAVELGVRVVACETALRLAQIAPERLAPGVEIAGMATLLADADEIVSF
ncbi:MAG: DsrE/DsrF/DrsH-like family protein [Rhodospirillales bacterium]|nr:DsrE/DsrF/DrsH-like family protein [Rhodospirillales bacterium]